MEEGFQTVTKKELVIPVGSIIKILPSLDSDRVYLEVTKGDKDITMMQLCKETKGAN